MRDLPQISEYLRSYGIKPEERGYNNRYTLIGLDTETIGNNDINVENDIYSMQMVKNSLQEEYFYLVSKEDVGIKMLDATSETDNFLFNRYSFITAHNLEFDLGALLGKDFLKLINYHKYKENDIKVSHGNVHFKGWDVKFTLGQSPFFMFRKKGTRLIFTDSRNWFKGSLDSIGKTFFNIAKKDKPSYLGQRAPSTDAEFKSFKEYAMQDARIQFLITKKIASLHENENVAMTITPASFSSKIFKKNFLTNRLFLERDESKLKLIWSTYHGARFESIGRGFFEDYNMYDVNSLYPYAMKMSPLNFSNTPMSNLTLNDIERGAMGFCRVEFKYRSPVAYPCLPVREEKLVFPYSGVSYCTSHELLNALNDIDIISFSAVGWYPAHEDINHPLSKYIDYVYNEKQLIAHQIKDLEKENNDYNYEEIMRLQIEYLKSKLKMNSLYGKFAQRNPVYDASSDKNISLAGAMFKPDFASLITGYSRKVIHDYMTKYGTIYCDTDSIISKADIEDTFDLGGLKKEHENIDFMIIRSKLYFGLNPAHDTVKKAAKHGFRISKQDAFDLLRKYDSKEVEYETTRMTKAMESQRSTKVTHSLPRKWVTDNFVISLAEDGKRVFDKNLMTSKQLFENSTLSMPLLYAESSY